MRTHSPSLLLHALLCAALLGAGCVTPVSEDDVEARLSEAARPFARLGPQRVIPIYAETRLIAVALVTEAKNDPESRVSVQLGRRLALAAKRRFHVLVVGGPYPDLSDRLLLNALNLHRDGELKGLLVVLVSDEEPSAALAEAARVAQTRLHHRTYR